MNNRSEPIATICPWYNTWEYEKVGGNMCLTLMRETERDRERQREREVSVCVGSKKNSGQVCFAISREMRLMCADIVFVFNSSLNYFFVLCLLHFFHIFSKMFAVPNPLLTLMPISFCLACIWNLLVHMYLKACNVTHCLLRNK